LIMRRTITPNSTVSYNEMPLLRTVRLKNTLIAVLGILALMLPVLMMLPAAASPTTTEYPLPTPTAYPYGITTGPDGALWFTEFYGNSIGRITPPRP